MSQAAKAHDPWADDLHVPRPSRVGRRQVVSWASAEELEILGGIGRDPTATWTVLTLDDDADVVVAADAADPALEATWTDPRLADTAGVDEPQMYARPVRHRFRRTGATSPGPAADRTPALRLTDHEAAAIDYVSEPPPPLLPGQRRTVVIRGHVPAPVAATAPDRRRPALRTRDRLGHRPDRVALWALVLGLLLILIAVLSAGGSA